MRKLALLTTLASLTLFSSAGEPAAKRATARSTPTVRYSQEKLDRIRQSLAAQIAVRDDAERAMRAPTPREASELAISAPDAGRVVAVPGGGIALARDASQLSAAIAVREADGTIRVAHRTPDAPRREAAKGGNNAR